MLALPRWFDPSFVVPPAGMIFANATNTVSLAAERDESQRRREDRYRTRAAPLRYQMMVMCMAFGSSGLGAALCLTLQPGVDRGTARCRACQR